MNTATQMRIVLLQENRHGIEDNDWYGVYQGAELIYDYCGPDALSIVLEWRADSE